MAGIPLLHPSLCPSTHCHHTISGIKLFDTSLSATCYSAPPHLESLHLEMQEILAFGVHLVQVRRTIVPSCPRHPPRNKARTKKRPSPLSTPGLMLWPCGTGPMTNSIRDSCRTGLHSRTAWPCLYLRALCYSMMTSVLSHLHQT